MSNNALGKGLSALIPDNSTNIERDNSDLSNNILQIPISDLEAGQYQPRRKFDGEKIEELSESIKLQGILQPIIVRKNLQTAKLEIIAGERRWRAAQKAGLGQVPVIIRDVSDKQALELAIIENVQREDLTPIEEAEGYKRLQEEFSYTQEELAKILGKSRSHISNTLRVLQLEDDIKKMIDDGDLTMGHARSLVKSENPKELAQKIAEQGLSVREAEKFASGYGRSSSLDVKVNNGGGTTVQATTTQTTTTIKKPTQKDDDIIALEESVTKKLGLKVSIDHDDQGGLVSIRFENLTQLDKILKVLSF